MFLLFSMVGSYESTNWFCTNCMVRLDFPVKECKLNLK